ncbi:MAG: sulfite exporter TauE/SafE family protein [Acetatifactor sp.]|nr:sulfite exporter TauE/SafE family protein [Acetatifactor sp.]
MVWQFMLCFLVMGGAAMVQNLSGFGFGIVAMSLLPYWMPGYSLSASLTTAMMCVTAAAAAFKSYRMIRWRLLLPPLLSYPLVNYAAISLSFASPDIFLQRALGVFLISLSLYFLFLKRRVKLRASVSAGLLAGALGAVMNGLFSMGGPPIVLYLLSASSDEEHYLASAQAYFCMTNLFSLIIRLRAAEKSDGIHYYLLSLAAVLLFGFLGRKIRRKLNGDSIRKGVYFLMIISGLVMCLKS